MIHQSSYPQQNTAYSVIWPRGTYLSLDVLGRTTESKQELAVLVKRLRHKLGVKIETVKGVGYIMASRFTTASPPRAFPPSPE